MSSSRAVQSAQQQGDEPQPSINLCAVSMPSLHSLPVTKNISSTSPPDFCSYLSEPSPALLLQKHLFQSPPPHPRAALRRTRAALISMHDSMLRPTPLYGDVAQEWYIKSHPSGPFSTSTLLHAAINQVGGKHRAQVFTVTWQRDEKAAAIQLDRSDYGGLWFSWVQRGFLVLSHLVHVTLKSHHRRRHSCCCCWSNGLNVHEKRLLSSAPTWQSLCRSGKLD